MWEQQIEVKVMLSWFVAWTGDLWSWGWAAHGCLGRPFGHSSLTVSRRSWEVSVLSGL